MKDVMTLQPIGHVRSPLRSRSEAPRAGAEGAPDAWLEMDPQFEAGLSRIAAGDEIVLVTWLHLANRDVLEVRPGGGQRPLRGVFTTRSPDRPNPLGLHRVTVREIAGHRLRVGPLEAIDGTPIVDIKPARDD